MPPSPLEIIAECIGPIFTPKFQGWRVQTADDQSESNCIFPSFKGRCYGNQFWGRIGKRVKQIM